jgi:hypothetical protein
VQEEGRNKEGRDSPLAEQTGWTQDRTSREHIYIVLYIIQAGHRTGQEHVIGGRSAIPQDFGLPKRLRNYGLKKIAELQLWTDKIQGLQFRNCWCTCMFCAHRIRIFSPVVKQLLHLQKSGVESGQL